VRRDGSAPETLAEQVDQVCTNIAAILGARRVPMSNIIKLTTFLTGDDDGDDCVCQARTKHLGEHRPASTAVFVRHLVDPAWKIELDAIALLPANGRSC
jgi:2-iminobutanoate/2-iminopropanoate deaminase